MIDYPLGKKSRPLDIDLKTYTIHQLYSKDAHAAP